MRLPPLLPQLLIRVAGPGCSRPASDKEQAVLSIEGGGEKLSATHHGLRKHAQQKGALPGVSPGAQGKAGWKCQWAP